MKILQIEPGRTPEAKGIDSTLEAMQEVVGGLIQALFPFEDPVALICNDEGKLLGLPANRALRDEEGKPYDILCGTFFFCGAPPDSDHFDSLTDEQVEKFKAIFHQPEMFLNVEGHVIVLPAPLDGIQGETSHA